MMVNKPFLLGVIPATLNQLIALTLLTIAKLVVAKSVVDSEALFNYVFGQMANDQMTPLCLFGPPHSQPVAG